MHSRGLREAGYRLLKTLFARRSMQAVLWQILGWLRKVQEMEKVSQEKETEKGKTDNEGGSGWFSTLWRGGVEEPTPAKQEPKGPSADDVVNEFLLGISADERDYVSQKLQGGN